METRIVGLATFECCDSGELLELDVLIEIFAGVDYPPFYAKRGTTTKVEYSQRRDPRLFEIEGKLYRQIGKTEFQEKVESKKKYL